jgi:hypothetical protein
MKKLIELVSHPELVAQIVSQFAFMKSTSEPQDGNYESLKELSLNDVFEKAHTHFAQFKFDFEIIHTEQCNLAQKIAEFLKQWAHITDVEAIQQNVHFNLQVLDEAMES